MGMPVVDLGQYAKAEFERNQRLQATLETIIDRADQAVALARSTEGHVKQHLPVVHPAPPVDESLPKIDFLTPKLDNVEGSLARQEIRLQAIEEALAKLAK